MDYGNASIEAVKRRYRFTFYSVFKALFMWSNGYSQKQIAKDGLAHPKVGLLCDGWRKVITQKDKKTTLLCKDTGMVECDETALGKKEVPKRKAPKRRRSSVGPNNA